MTKETRTWKGSEGSWHYIVTIEDEDGTRYYIDGQPATKSDVLGMMDARSN